MEKEVISHLVLAAGYSKYNATEAVRKFYAGELSEAEHEVMVRIFRNPANDEIPSTKVRGRILDHLTIVSLKRVGEQQINETNKKSHSKEWLFFYR